MLRQSENAKKPLLEEPSDQLVIKIDRPVGNQTNYNRVLFTNALLMKTLKNFLHPLEYPSLMRVDKMIHSHFTAVDRGLMKEAKLKLLANQKEIAKQIVIHNVGTDRDFQEVSQLFRLNPNHGSNEIVKLKGGLYCDSLIDTTKLILLSFLIGGSIVGLVKGNNKGWTIGSSLTLAAASILFLLYLATKIKRCRVSQLIDQYHHFSDREGDLVKYEVAVPVSSSSSINVVRVRSGFV